MLSLSKGTLLGVSLLGQVRLPCLFILFCLAQSAPAGSQYTECASQPLAVPFDIYILSYTTPHVLLRSSFLYFHVPVQPQCSLKCGWNGFPTLGVATSSLSRPFLALGGPALRVAGSRAPLFRPRCAKGLKCFTSFALATLFFCRWDFVWRETCQLMAIAVRSV